MSSVIFSIFKPFLATIPVAEENVLQTGSKMVGSFWNELVKLVTNLLAAFLIFVLVIFVFGELYAIYFMQIENAFMLWLPVFLLMVVLAYKVIE